MLCADKNSRVCILYTYISADTCNPVSCKELIGLDVN